VSDRKHPLAKCEECPLYEVGKYVPTAFPSDEPNGIAVVGEAPGFREAVYGEPFKGPSGKLLDKVLEYNGINRRQTLLTNACLCRPEDNATPDAKSLAACKPRLMAELEGVEKVLALGNSAAKTVLNTTAGITSLRVGPAREKDGRKVVSTFHPAYCLRNGDHFPSLVNDTAKLVLDPPEWTPPHYDVVDDEASALNAIEFLSQDKYPELVVDIEVGIEKDISFDHPSEHEMLCIGVCYEKGKVVVFGENSFTERVWKALKELFRRKKLSNHNGKFDLEGLFKYVGSLKLYFDTMLAHYCLDERPGGHSLGQLGVEILGCPDWKGEIGKYLGPEKNYAHIPRPILYRYNAYDVAVTWDLKEYFEAELPKHPNPWVEGETLRDLHDFLVDAANELMFLELNGVAIDKATNRKLAQEYLGRMAELEQGMDAIIDKDYDAKGGINPRSPKQVKEYLHDQGIRVASTAADILEDLYLKRLGEDTAAHRFVGQLLKYRREAKLYGTYIKGIANRMYRGRVFTTYLLHGTTSGRLASRNPNLQNIVRNEAIRGQFAVSRPGNLLIHNDYKQAEGRVIAVLARDEYLLNIFRDPTRDLFPELGQNLYGTTELTKDQSVRVKAYFYGLSYGREAYSIALEYDLPVRETEEGLREFKKLIPGVTAWQEEIKKAVHRGDDLITTFGRHRRFFLITKENKTDVENEALSFYPQSTASDICLRALIRTRPQLKNYGPAYLRMTIHDAMIAESPEDKAPQVADLMRYEMERSGEEWCKLFPKEYRVPFTVDSTTGTNWGQL
jgi:uracil-DNA glycosylase family 4